MGTRPRTTLVCRTGRPPFPGIWYLDPAKLVPLPAYGWKVLYHSVSATGNAIEVSGTVLVPKASWSGPGPRPLISYGVGTHGMGDQCAPSYELARGTDNEAEVLDNLLRQGWAEAATDFEKLGTPGVHTYAVGISQGHAVLDAARAAMRLPGSGLSADAPVGLWGFSQGGQPVAWAAQQAATYAPELAIKGAVAGGVPADLLGTVGDIDGGPFAGLGFGTLLGHDSAYRELDLERYLNDAGRAAMDDGKDDCAEEAVAKNAFKKISGVPVPRSGRRDRAVRPGGGAAFGVVRLRRDGAVAGLPGRALHRLLRGDTGSDRVDGRPVDRRRGTEQLRWTVGTVGHTCSPRPARESGVCGRDWYPVRRYTSRLEKLRINDGQAWGSREAPSGTTVRPREDDRFSCRIREQL